MKEVNIKAKKYDERNRNCNNTVLLLKKYRDLAMEVAVDTGTLKRTIEKEYGSNTSEFLDILRKYNVKINKNEKLLKEINECNEKNNVLKSIEGYLNIIKDTYKNGNKIYSILYHTYLRKYELTVDSIRNYVTSDLNLEYTMCKDTYFKYLKQGIYLLDSIIWTESNPYTKEIVSFLKNV